MSFLAANASASPSPARLGAARSYCCWTNHLGAGRPIQQQALTLLRDAQQRYGVAYLFISHDLAVIRAMAPTCWCCAT